MAENDVDAVLAALRDLDARAIEAGFHHGQPINLSLIAKTAGLEDDDARHALGTLIRQHTVFAERQRAGERFGLR